MALEKHVSTKSMNALWDDAGEASRNGKDYMDWVEERSSTSQSDSTIWTSAGSQHDAVHDVA